MTWLNNLWKKIKKVGKIERSTLLNKTSAVRKNKSPFFVTYGQTLPNIRETVNKHCHILSIHNTFRKCSRQKQHQS